MVGLGFIPGLRRIGNSEHDGRAIGEVLGGGKRPAFITRGCPAVHWHYRLFSRPALGAGLVALRQTFVRRCYGGLGSSRACGVLAIQNMSAGQSESEP